MADKEVKKWITINGVHVPIFEGQSKDEVVKNFIDKHEDNGEKKTDSVKVGKKDVEVHKTESKKATTYDRDSFDKEAERQGLDLTSDDIDEYVEASYGARELGDKISEFIDNAPQDMKVGDDVLYRGLYFNSEDEMRDFIEAGMVTSRRDGLSWTTDKEVADVFSREASDYSVTLVNDDDAKNAISIKDISDTPSSSSEVLYSSSTDFEIIDVEFEGTHATVYVTEAVRSKQKY